MKANSVLQTIGNTPHIRFGRLFPTHEVWIKSERANPGGSIKDRIGLSMIEAAEKAGRIKPDTIILEPTSGNTGIGLAMVGAALGYKVVLTMPECVSMERRKVLEAFGAPDLRDLPERFLLLEQPLASPEQGIPFRRDVHAEVPGKV